MIPAQSLPSLHGASLASVTLSWEDGTAELLVKPPPGHGGELRLRFTSVSRMLLPRQGQWRQEEGIEAVHGPFALDKETSHVRIAMKSGDVIELDYGSLDLVRDSISAITAEPLGEHPQLPHLHDAPLLDLRLRWREGTAELLAGPVLHTVQSSLGSSHVRLRFGGVQRLRCPRAMPWGYFSADIGELVGPVRISGDLWYLRVQMQGGDVIELDYQTVEVERATSTDPTISPPPDR